MNGTATTRSIRDGKRVYPHLLYQRPRRRGHGHRLGSYLNLTALGRQEEWENSPEGYPQTPRYKWWNWHDNYDAGASPDPKWVEVSATGEATFRKRDAADPKPV